MADIYLEVGTSIYPSDDYVFSPSILYPEYPWELNTISKSDNNVYEMVRNSLIGLGMDAENVGSSKWNPFKDIISEGDTVVLKPNLVMHINENRKIKEHSLDCLVTHPSVVRAICDYCLIALNGTGQVIIGDAPMQGCDLQELLDKTGYSKMLKFYQDIGAKVSLYDFREYRSVFDKNKVITKKEYTGGSCINVDLGFGSVHYSQSGAKQLYQVSDYDKKITNEYHNGQKHCYSINEKILQADVVVNICKPKCHRLAGITGALKNMVGITYNKASLPHRKVGSKEEGGDEYLHKSCIKKLISIVLSRKIRYEDNHKIKRAMLMRYIYGILFYLVKFFGKDKYLIGSWYGNDTIWRTVLDLNTILLYADKTGELKNTKQRKVFHFADMIISGEHNGPVSPSPKKIGIILAGENSVFMDRVICEMMGFDYKKIPGLEFALNNSLFNGGNNNINIQSNIQEYCTNIDEVIFPDAWHFTPHDSWNGHIEK